MAGSPTAGQLHSLCRQGNVAAIREQLQTIADVSSNLEERVGFLGYTPLHEATNRGHVGVVRLLLLYEANASAKANGSYTPLHIAASMNNVECVRELIEHSADITSCDEFGKTPYKTAVINGCRDAAKLLKSAEIKKAASENDPNLKELLKSVDDKGVTPQCFQEALLQAIRSSHLEAITAILLVGSKENLRLKDAIREAVRFHFNDAVALLLVCYAAKHAKEELLKYIMGMEISAKELEVALENLPYASVLQMNMEQIKAFLQNRQVFQVAVPIQFASQHKKTTSMKILLRCTNCNMDRREVEWRKLALCEIDASWLEQVKWVEKLYLSSNLLTAVPSATVDLTRLWQLDLRKNKLRTVPAELLQMPLLKELFLSENRISSLPKKCVWSPSLRTLKLSENELEKLPSTMASAKLVNLYLAKNNLYEVPACVCELATLELLDLSSNPRLTSLPIEMGKLKKLTVLKLHDLEQMTDPPDSIKKDAEKTIMHLRASLRSSRRFYGMKLLLVGKANQGKTTLMHRLMWDYNYNINSPTNGISMNEMTLRKDLRHRPYQFKVWDFGGQEDYHATHQLFLSTLGLYVLVWNLVDGTYGIDQLEGWLDTISARSPGATLVIVGTHLDVVRKEKEQFVGDYLTNMQKQVRQLAMLRKYARINIVAIKEVSSSPDMKEEIDNLRITIYDAATRMLKSKRSQLRVMGELIPASYHELADLIQKQRNKLLEAGELPIMHRADYEALVLDTIRNLEGVEDPDDVQEVTKFLHERGFLIHYDDPNQDLQDFYFVDPKWLCEMMARVVTLREVNPFIMNGILNKSDFAFTFKGEKFADENYPQFIRLLNRFQIACSLDDERVLVPSKLPADEPAQATADQLPFITIKRFHSLPYMPYGFWNRFTARILSYVNDMLAFGDSTDGWSQHVRYDSPFQLDPFCCRCPLTMVNAVPVESSPRPSESSCAEPEAEVEPSYAAVAEECGEDGEDEFDGFGGLWINGNFIRNDFEGGDASSRSDSGFEFSNSDGETDNEDASLRDDTTDRRKKDVYDTSGRGAGFFHAQHDSSETDGAPNRSSPSVVKHSASEPHGFAPRVSTPTRSASASGGLETEVESRLNGQRAQAGTPAGGSSTGIAIPGSSARLESHVTGDVSPPPTHSSSGSAALSSPQAPVASAPSSSSTRSPSPFVFVNDESFLRELTDDVFAAPGKGLSRREGEGTFISQDSYAEDLRCDAEPCDVGPCDVGPCDVGPCDAEPCDAELSDDAENSACEASRRSLSPSFIRSISEEQTHQPDCPCTGSFPMDGLPDLPGDLRSLVDDGFLHCWLSGVCLHHPRLFFMVTHEPDPTHEGRQRIVTQVSPSPLGRRILSYVVDHVDTLIREWYPSLSLTDGRELVVRQYIPCVVCERLGVEPHNFSFVKCQRHSAQADRIECPKHRGLDLNLHHVAPDIMMHDVEVDLLVSHDQLMYENSETSFLGSGGFGKVIRGECRNQPVAIKFYNSGDETDPLKHYLEVRKELNVLRRVAQHPFLINIVGVCLRPLCLVLELAERGSLLDALVKPVAVHRVVLFRVAYQVADALAFLHRLGVIYRDLKPENVLVWSLDEKQDLHVKLIDFGTANFATSTGLFSCTGSKGNHAPEMLASKDEYSAQVDVYSYAILLYRLITRRSPFQNIDSEPQVNAAVLRGERPEWKDVYVTSFGLPTLTELMLRCWLTKPTLRPTTARIADQLRLPTFQALLGKQAVPTHHSVRCSCLTNDKRELLLACDDSKGNKVLVFDTRTLEVKISFSIDSHQDKKCAFRIQCMQAVSAEHLLIGLRGDFNLINVYSIANRYKFVCAIPLNVEITSLASNDEFVFVGLNEGRVTCIWKKDLKKADKKPPAHAISVERHQIQSLAVVKDRLWVAASKYIFSYFTTADYMEAFDMEALWYGGPERVRDNPQVRVANLTVSFEEESVWSTCRAVLIRWNANNRQKECEVDCAPIISQLSSDVDAGVTSEVTSQTEDSTVNARKMSTDSEACITCLMLTYETAWVSTTSGHILIFNCDNAQLLTWFHVFQDVRTLNMCIGPGPCETEQCYVISSGKGLLAHGLATTDGTVVCPLTPERVNEISDEESPRKSSVPLQKRNSSLSSLKRFKINPDLPAAVTVDCPPAKASCVMVVWEAVSANVFARMEAKSGRNVIRLPRGDAVAGTAPT